MRRHMGRLTSVNFSSERLGRSLLLCSLVAAPLATVGCGNDNGIDAGQTITVTGTVRLPAGVSATKSVAAFDTFQVVDFERSKNSQTVATGVTGSEGEYEATLPPTRALAVIVTDVVRVSGLISADPGENSGSSLVAKDFNGVTDVACEAGATAISDGSVSASDFDPERIANLEAAAQLIDNQVNHADPASVTAGAARVRQLTDDGAHPPTS